MKKHYELPLLIEKDEDGFYVVECPVFSGCYTQGKTIDDAIKNIQEVIHLCVEETVSVPKMLLRKLIQLIIVPFENKKKKTNSLRGRLSKYANHNLINMEKYAWKNSIKD